MNKQKFIEFESKIDYHKIFFYLFLAAAITIIFKLCSFESPVKPVAQVQNSHTPLINSLTKSLTKFMVKQKVDSMDNAKLLAKIPPVEYRYIKASNKAGTDLQNKICDTITIRNLKQAADSMLVAHKAALKSDSIVKADLWKGQAGWRELNNQQKKRNTENIAIIDSLITKALPAEFKRGKRVGRKQVLIVGGVAVILVEAANVAAKVKP